MSRLLPLFLIACASSADTLDSLGPADIAGPPIGFLLTAQSTVEFYINRERRAAARARGRLWRNPFDLGPLRNWQQVYGTMPIALAVLPSTREPPPPLTPFAPAECGLAVDLTNRSA